MTNKTAVCGMFSNRREAQNSIDRLLQEGFPQKDVSILVKKKDGPHDFVHGQPSNVGHGAMTGAIVGFFILGLVGFFLGFNSTSGIVVNQMSFQNQSSVPTVLISTLTGAIIGALIGMVAGALSGIGIPQLVNHRYGFYLNEGGLLVAVHVDTPARHDRAKIILDESGAQDVAGLFDAEVWELALLV